MKTELSSKGLSFGKRIDFHTHILPEMDDGSASAEMSLQMLASLKKQGAFCVALTPHFYPQRDTPQHFLQKRKARLELLMSRLNGNAPMLLIGAEVQYFDGITAMRDLPQMRLGNTEGLLIEMPMGSWSKRMVGDLLELNSRRGYQVILAHVERYLPFGNGPLLPQLADSGVMLQISSGAFKGFFEQRKMLKLLDQGLIHLLGSDCHNTTSRPPDLADGYETIERKRGGEAVRQIVSNGLLLLETNQAQSASASADKEYIR